MLTDITSQTPAYRYQFVVYYTLSRDCPTLHGRVCDNLDKMARASVFLEQDQIDDLREQFESVSLIC